MSAEDYYRTLGVSKNASNDEIKAAYRKLAFEYHPDRNSSAYAKERIKEINLAYDTLSDPEKRTGYDRRAGFTTGPAGSAGPTGNSGAQGYYWKKEYTWTWGGQGTSRKQDRDGQKGYTETSRASARNSSGASKRGSDPRSKSSPERRGGSSTWETVDMILRILGGLAIFWLILRRPTLIVLLVITAAFLLAVWAFFKNLMQVSGKR